MVDEGLIDLDEALRRVTGAQLAQLMFPRFDEKAERTLLAKGMNASPGAAVGKAVFDSATAVEWAEQGEDVILVRKETTPDDLHGMVVARASSPAAAARPRTPPSWPAAWAAPASAAPSRSTSTPARASSRVRGGKTVDEGDVISIDGTTGEVFDGAVPVVDSLVVRYFEGDETTHDDDRWSRRWPG